MINRTWSGVKRPEPILAISGARNLTVSGTRNERTTRGSEAMVAAARGKRRSLSPSVSRRAGPFNNRPELSFVPTSNPWT
jgi:hypothetical protein